MTVRCFEQVIDCPLISEILLVDDASTDDSWKKLLDKFGDNEKIRLTQQYKRRGMSQNKADAIGLSRSEWVAIIDSDNIVDPSYFSALSELSPHVYQPEDILMPEFAKEQFDYRQFSGMWIDKSNVKEVISTPMGNCLFNTANYVVNKSFYYKTYRHNPEHIASDTIWHNYNHLLAGGKFFVVPGLQYIHTVHPESGFLEDAQYNMKMAEQVRQKIIEL